MIFIKLICKGRGQGKTYDLILESARTGIPILTPYPTIQIINMTKRMGQEIPKPIYAGTYLRDYRCVGDKLLVDEIDAVLGMILKAHIETATLTPDSLTEKENNTIVNNVDTPIGFSYTNGRLIYNPVIPLLERLRK